MEIIFLICFLWFKSPNSIIIKKFGLIDWVERDLLILRRISTSDNYADAMTKALGTNLFYRHFDYILGKHIPKYCTFASREQQNVIWVLCIIHCYYIIYLVCRTFVFYRRRGGYHTIWLDIGTDHIPEDIA